MTINSLCMHSEREKARDEKKKLCNFLVLVILKVGHPQQWIHMFWQLQACVFEIISQVEDVHV